MNPNECTSHLLLADFGYCLTCWRQIIVPRRHSSPFVTTLLAFYLHYLTTAAAIETMAHRIVSTPLFLAAVLLLLVQSSVAAFSSVRSFSSHRPSVTKKCVSTTSSSTFSPLIIGRTVELRMSTDNNNDEEEAVGLPPLPSQLAQTAVVDETNSSQKEEEEAVVSSSSSAATTAVEEETTSYPIDLPSPILLASSMVLAISSTGKKKVLT